MKAHLKDYILILAIVATLSIIISIQEEDIVARYSSYISEAPQVTGAASHEPAQIQAGFSTCDNVATPGYSTLDADILNSNTASCINITVDNVIFNCQWKIIDGQAVSPSVAIQADNRTNVTIGNCSISDWQYGLNFTNTNDSFIINNTINNSGNAAIRINDNNLIQYNKIFDPATYGIRLDGNNNTVDLNTINRTSIGISATSTSNNTIINNTVESSTTYGIYAGSTVDSNISDNTLNHNAIGIRFDSGNNLKNFILNNTIYNSTTGIYLIEIQNATIRRNKISNTTTGILFTPPLSTFLSGNNLFVLNTIETSTTGIKTNSLNDTRNRLVSNTIRYNLNGIHLYQSTNISIENNIIYNNTNAGVLLEGVQGGPNPTNYTENISLNNNNIYNNSPYGISANIARNNSLINNQVYFNYIGVSFSESGNNTITLNKIYSNSQRGIEFTTSSYFNKIYDNNFTNTNNVYDDSANYWNTSKTAGTNIIGGPNIGGNFYSDYTGTDNNDDGIGETTHSISGGGSSVDFLPLTNIKNTTLVIWDELDPDLPYANKTRYVYDQVFFFANYTNTTGIITGAECNITINTTPAIGPVNMAYNSTKSLYEYNTSFTKGGFFNWSVDCNQTTHQYRNATENITILFNTTLDIWDETDSSLPYGDKLRYINDSVFFFANYTNTTDTQSGATCNISFGTPPAGPFNMYFNATKNIHEYNRTFSTKGTFNWNTTCGLANHTIRTQSDTVNITSNNSLTIWDELDPDLPYANQTRYIYDQVFFFANYTNETTTLSGATCNISFNTTPLGPFNMSFNATKNIHEYNRTFDTPGTYSWNVTCNQTNEITLFENNTIDLLFNTSIELWDETDSGLPYADQIKVEDEQVLFFTNYTNATGPLPNATCNISFGTPPTGPFTMAFNTTREIYQYNRSFSTSGTFVWNTTCTRGNYTTRTGTHTVLILENASITIWDEVDTGVTYGDQERYVSDQVVFFSNYTNSTGPLPNATCNISFELAPNGPFNMAFNTTKNLFAYNRSIDIPGTFNWNVSCNQTNIETLNATNDITILYNSTLELWDETDANLIYANQTKFKNEPVLFFANYTNQTNIVTNASCNISFGTAPIGPFNMIFNTTHNLYEYNRTFSAPDTYSWNVRCAEANHTTQNVFNSVNISSNNTLTIWDELDTLFTYGGQTKFVTDQIFFFSNYTNATETLPNATCNISFGTSPTGPFTMPFNTTKNLHEYNRSFDTPGTYNWNVSCNQTNEDTLTETETITVNLISNLTIWDETDSGVIYGGQSKNVDEQVLFFSNYTNSTDTLPNATCTVTFGTSPTGPFNMGFNTTKNLHEYNRSFNSTGVFNWNVNCNQTNYTSLGESDTVIISTAPSNGAEEGEGGGGSGGTGGGGSAPVYTPPGEEDGEEIGIIIDVISDGDGSYDPDTNKVTVDYSKTKQSIRELEINLTEDPTEDIIIETNETSLEEARKLFNITEEFMSLIQIVSNLDPDNIEGVSFIIRIPNAFFIDQRIDPASTEAIVILEEHIESATIEYLRTTSIYSYYKVTATDLANFALVGESIPKPTVNFIPVQSSIIALIASLAAGGIIFYKKRGRGIVSRELHEKTYSVPHKIPETEMPMQRITLELDRYVRQALRKNVPLDIIRQKLLKVGWKPHTIDYLLNKLKSKQ